MIKELSHLSSIQYWLVIYSQGISTKQVKNLIDVCPNLMPTANFVIKTIFKIAAGINVIKWSILAGTNHLTFRLFENWAHL
jgi:hypothetical protein